MVNEPSVFEPLKLYGSLYKDESTFHDIMLLMLGLNNIFKMPGRVAQSVGHLTRKSGVLGSIPRLATYFRFTFRFFTKGSYQLLAKVCARGTD